MKIIIIVIVFFCFNSKFVSQNKLQLKLYVKSQDHYFVSASRKDSSFLDRNYYLRYKVINNTKDTIRFNSLHFSSFTTKIIKEEEVPFTYGFFKLTIDDKGWNKELNYCNKAFQFDVYKKLDDKLLLSYIKIIPPLDSIDESVKSFCCPKCDVLNDVVFKKDYKIDEKYIKAQLKYNSKKKLYEYPKRAKYWKGILESEIIFF